MRTLLASLATTLLLATPALAQQRAPDGASPTRVYQEVVASDIEAVLRASNLQNIASADVAAAAPSVTYRLGDNTPVTIRMANCQPAASPATRCRALQLTACFASADLNNRPFPEAAALHAFNANRLAGFAVLRGTGDAQRLCAVHTHVIDGGVTGLSIQRNINFFGAFVGTFKRQFSGG